MAKISSKGIKVSYSDTSGGTYTDIKGLGDVTFNFPERDFQDNTTHDSSGDYREWAPALYGEGSVESSIMLENPEHASHTWLYTKKDSGDLAYFKVTLPKVGTTFSFAGFVQKFGIDAPVSGSLSAPLGIRISGSIVKASS